MSVWTARLLRLALWVAVGVLLAAFVAPRVGAQETARCQGREPSLAGDSGVQVVRVSEGSGCAGAAAPLANPGVVERAVPAAGEVVRWLAAASLGVGLALGLSLAALRLRARPDARRAPRTARRVAGGLRASRAPTSGSDRLRPVPH